MPSATTTASESPLRNRLDAALSRLRQVAWKQHSRVQLSSLLRRTGGYFDTLPPRRDFRPQVVSEITAACILDDFSFRAFKDEMHLVPVRENDWHEAFRDPVDLFFVEAFWRGSEGSWRGIAYDYNVKERELLKRLARWCRGAGIPTVFWNKEDPAHFDEFIDIAGEFDHVLTTDSSCVQRYAERGITAEVMQFAAQPSLHNPIEAYPERIDRACFAGSYMRTYSQRMKDLDVLADALRDLGLDIYDRNLDRQDDRYAFPERYSSMVKGTLKGDEIVKAYKGYRFGLNLNSVKGSDTMLARRVFELMASNTPVISNGSRAIERTFPGLVLASDDPAVIRAGVEELRTSVLEYRLRRLMAMREVMLHHTYRDRAGQVARTALGISAPAKQRGIVCVSFATGTEAASIKRAFDRQTFPFKELVVVHDDSELAEVVRRSATAGTTTSLLRPNDHYGPNYLTDVSLAFYYSGAQLVTKLSHYRGEKLVDDGNQYRWVERACHGALSFDPSSLGLEEAVRLLKSSIEVGDRRCLSIDEFNYVEGYPGVDTSPWDV